MDENGRVDFSLDEKNELQEKYSRPDPKSAERFMGRMFDFAPMPNGDRIIALYRWDDADPDLPLEIENHNVFRIDSSRNVVWQVRRDEEKFVNWDSRNKHAKEDNPDCEGYSDPFMNLSEKFFVRTRLPDRGFFHEDFKTTYFDEYAPGRLLSLTTQWWAYDLNPETGVATCTGKQVR